MQHVVDEETGEVRGCVKSAEELERSKKSQMVRTVGHCTMSCDYRLSASSYASTHPLT